MDHICRLTFYVGNQVKKIPIGIGQILTFASVDLISGPNCLSLILNQT